MINIQVLKNDIQNSEVTLQITAPLSWWKELPDINILKTISNLNGIMLQLISKPITLDSFSFEGVSPAIILEKDKQAWVNDLVTIVHLCETYRKKYLQTKEPQYWKRLFQILPQNWNCTITKCYSYDTLRKIIEKRNMFSFYSVEWGDFSNFIDNNVFCYSNNDEGGK